MMVTIAQTGIADDWSSFMGPDRNSRSTETGLWAKIDQPPKLNWTADGLGAGYGSVSIDNGRAFTTGNTESNQIVTCTDIKSGEPVWSQPITEDVPKHGYGGSRCTPTIDGDRVYVVSSGGSIHCLNSSDGAVVWSRKFSDWNGRMMSGWGFSESPLVDGEAVLCTPGGAEGMIVSLNKMTGDENWACPLADDSSATNPNTGNNLREGAAYSSIVISEATGVRQYVQLVGRGVIGVRASDGRLLWTYRGVSNSTANIPAVIATEDQIFCSTAYNTGSALLTLKKDGSGGVTVTEEYFLPAKTLQNKHGGMVLVDGYIYCGHGNGKGLPICVELATGKIAWGPVRGQGKGESSVVYADGNIVFRYENGVVELVKATPREFVSIGSFMPDFQKMQSWSYPVISNGVLYLREQEKLMSYQLK